MAYCSNCGKELKPDDRFCSRCGARAGVREDREERENREERPAAGSSACGEKKEGGKRGNNGVIITGMICATAVVLVVAVLIFFARSKKPEPSSSALVMSSAASGESDSAGGTLAGETSSQTISNPATSAAGAGAKETKVAGSASVSKPASEAAGPGNPASGAETDLPLKDWPDRETLPFSTNTFYMELPGTWADHYSLEKWENYYDFYNTENQNAGAGGFLFSIGFYEEYGLWEDLPSYEFLAEKDGVYYVAEFPTDVQFDAANEAIYYEMREDIDGILATFTLK